MSEIYSPGSIPGPVGPAGPPANFAGTYSAGTTYNAGQAVSYTPNGNSYISLAGGNTGNEPDTSPTWWGLLATASGLTTSAVNMQIAAATSNVLPAMVAYSGAASTTATIGASGLAGDTPYPHGLGLLQTMLPVGSLLESITMQLGSPGTVDIVLTTIVPVAPNAPTAAPSAVLERFTLSTDAAVVLSPGLYQWRAGSNFAPIAINTANTAIGIVNDGTAQVLINPPSGTGLYVSTNDNAPLTGQLYNWGGQQLDMSVVTRTIVPPLTIAQIDSSVASSMASEVTAIDAGIAVPLAYATLGSTSATIGVSNIAVNGTTGNNVVLPGVLPLHSYLETMTLHLSGPGLINVMIGTYGGTPNPPDNQLFTVTQVVPLNTANAVEIATNIYQWTASVGYPMLQITQANSGIGLLMLANNPQPAIIQRTSNGTGTGYYVADGSITGTGTSGMLYDFDGGQLDFSVFTRTLVPLATQAQLSAAIAALSPGGVTAVKGRVSSCLISCAGSPYSGSADFIVSATGAEVGINPIIASFSQANQDGCRIYLDIGFSTTGPIVLDGDNIELSGMNHAMWGGYNHAWSGTNSPAGAVGSNANITATTSAYPILQMQYNMQGTDTTRHRGTCIHDLYLVGNNYTSTGISVPQMDDNVTIRDMVIQRCAIGMSLNLDSPTIYHNSLQDVIQGIQISGVFPRITENLIFDIGGIGVSSAAVNAIVRGNIIGDCAGGGLLSTGPNLIVEANQFATNNGVAIQLNQYSDNAVVSNNVIDCNNSLYGFNSIFPNGFDRIQVNNCSGVLVTGNLVKNQTSGNTGFGVNFNGTVAACGVFHNLFRGTFNAGGSPLNVGSNANANNVMG
jgi:hypothetical protein